MFHLERVTLRGFYIFLWLLVPFAFVSADSNDDESHFLYGEDAGPVQDYHGEGEADPLKPAFLFGTGNGPRMVEFYAYWCPHCRHFREHYVQLARQVTTVAASQGVKVTVHAIPCTEYRSICKEFDVNGYPKIKVFPANSTSYSEINYWEAHPFDVLRDMGVQPTTALRAVQTSNKQTQQKTDHVSLYRSKSDLFNDAYLSFHFALKNGIFMSSGPLSSKARDAFSEWLSLLKRALPPTWEIQKLIKALVDDFDTICEGEERLVKVADQFPPPTKKWSEACTKGVKGMGYTCGLWELFHIMTVGVVEWNLMIYDGEHMILSVDDVAVTLRNYIETFFGCEVCRENFLHGFDTCARDRCSRLHHSAGTQSEWAQLPLWLFEVHNGVNVRLMRERSEREKWTPTREDEVKAEWPSRDACPQCWREDGGWDEEIVYKYLRIEYWIDDAIAGVYRKQISKIEDEDDSNDTTPSFILQLVLVLGVTLIGIWWYVKDFERRKTGRHKRIL